tara:strand:+ start:46 stop:453 length:408 start_codon:yes stop_codon:yes gene_type:complete
MKMTLRNSQQGVEQMRSLWEKMKVALDNGVELTVEVSRPNRSLQQNAMYHSIILAIAKQSRHLGSTWDADSWKRLLVDAYTKELGQNTGQVIPNLAGDGIVQLGLQTRKFTKAQASEFSEWLMAWCAENGVTIHE